MVNPNIDWGGDQPDRDEVAGEYIIVRIDTGATDEERAAAEKYTKYINRFNKEGAAT